MFGPVDTAKTYTVVTVHTPCQVGCLRRAVLPRGVYQYQGDLRPKVRQLSERRKILAGMFSIEVFNAPKAAERQLFTAREQLPPTVSDPVAITPDSTEKSLTAVGVLTQQLNGRTKLRKLEQGVVYELRGGYTVSVRPDTCEVRVEHYRTGVPAVQHWLTFADAETMGATSARQAINTAMGLETAPTKAETEPLPEDIIDEDPVPEPTASPADEPSTAVGLAADPEPEYEPTTVTAGVEDPPRMQTFGSIA